MDAKALAKLKRAHSQRHSKKFHPNQISKLPSTGTGSSNCKKSSEKQVRERNKPSLPSNWERYKEERDSDIDELFQEGICQDTDVILPKSDGADYAYLISEAKAQSEATISLESFPSFDDVLDDLHQGFGSLLSAKGKSILSWVEDDNFVIDDKATASHEAPFLSLSLHNLAEELAKVDLSRRLFLEADLLPAELCNNDTVQASGKQEVGKGQPTNDAEAVSNDNTGILGSHSPSEGVTDMNKYSKILSSERNSSSSSHPVPVFEIKDSKCINQVRDEMSISYRMDDSTSTEHTVNAVVHESKKPSQFQAEAAEAELDMLLDSLTGTSLPTSNPARNSTHFNSSHDKTSTLSVEGSNTWSSQKGTRLSRSTMLSDNLDDALDDLLKETSNIKAGVSQFNEKSLARKTTGKRKKKRNEREKRSYREHLLNQSQEAPACFRIGVNSPVIWVAITQSTASHRRTQSVSDSDGSLPSHHWKQKQRSSNQPQIVNNDIFVCDQPRTSWVGT